MQQSGVVLFFIELTMVRVLSINVYSHVCHTSHTDADFDVVLLEGSTRANDPLATASKGNSDDLIQIDGHLSFGKGAQNTYKRCKELLKNEDCGYPGFAHVSGIVDYDCTNQDGNIEDCITCWFTQCYLRNSRNDLTTSEHDVIAKACDYIINLRKILHMSKILLAIGSKYLLEQQEVAGMDVALRYISSTLVNRSGLITKQDILDIHRRVQGFVDPVEAGHLRRDQVYVCSLIPPSVLQIEEYLEEFLIWLNSVEETRDLHPIILASLVHYKLVLIHPFLDGNGRTARLLMNLVLMRSGFTPVTIKDSERLTYYDSLYTANMGNIRPFIHFIAKCTEQTSTEFIHYSSRSSTSASDLELLLSDDKEETLANRTM
ncbi:unnamed protein product [Didymodactylos carnosus]|uniref:Fido domain-containing protein n=1 Tax=Didymodactylos carnosus TaxID=1234261 RepID=A0A814WUV6_9BILA|nr:unnamed protein product [Didymodactylos carnosus]CAF1217539.1 unnamed protein product [Didymodactylos carnosus]CAF3971539.1 unnamed protein product [Didymodactylos carnosus]CAF4025896.1 unnamed protein product [Didymodactylos carnosus]